MTVKRALYLYLFTIAFPSNAFSQSINVRPGAISLRPRDTLSVTVSVDSAAVDAYYLELEAGFDPLVLEFLDAAPAGLFAGGLSVADLLQEGRVGASVSRTSALAAPGSGDLMRLRFRVLQKSPAGLSALTFGPVALRNSSGASIPAAPPGPVDVQVEEAVSELRLELPPTGNTLLEGDELPVDASVYVNGITPVQPTESARLGVWIGVHDSAAAPAGWPETAWVRMAFSAQTGEGYHRYGKEVGFGLSPGSWHIALRGQLDTGPFAYSSSTAELEVTAQPAFRYVLAGWDFDAASMQESRSVPANDSLLFRLVGAATDGFTSGASGQAADAEGWEFTPGDEKYWHAALSTLGFGGITVSSRQSGTSSGPRDFEIEASLDSLSWELLTPDTIRVSAGWSDAVVSELPLPAAYEDQPKVHIRWIRRGDRRVDGALGITVGKNRIDDVIIGGRILKPAEAFVWPGDTDQNGLVDELDVFPIALYWLAEGPPPVFPSIAFASRKVEEWIPAAATHADADGDGMVNHKDLLPVGLHFGKARSEGSVSPKNLPAGPVGQVELPVLKAGERLAVRIASPEAVSITGLSARLYVEGVSPADWIIAGIETGVPAGRPPLSFIHRESGSPAVAATIAAKGVIQAVSTGELMTLRLQAVRDWKAPGRLLLERLVTARNDEKELLVDVLLAVQGSGTGGPPGGEIPEAIRLYQNYPNPFNPSTVIRYDLPVKSRVSLAVYDMAGRKVATLVSGALQSPGRYALRYTPNGLASGLYIYRLRAGNRILTKKFVLLK